LNEPISRVAHALVALEMRRAELEDAHAHAQHFGASRVVGHADQRLVVVDHGVGDDADVDAARTRFAHALQALRAGQEVGRDDEHA